MLFNLKTFMLYLRISISFHAANRRGVCIVISRDSSLVFVDQKILFFYFPIDLEIKVEENVIQSHAVQNAHNYWGEEDGNFLMCTYEMYICSHVPEIRLI